MVFLPILSLALLLPFAQAQTNDSALQIAAIEAHFKQSQIVPQLLSSFEPSALLTVNYAGVGDITPGQPLTEDQSASAPSVTVTSANSSAQLTGKFTITMVDADIVGSDLSKGENRHWLVNGVTIANGTVSNSSATAITAYAGPGPAAGSGPHRYVIMLYAQPDSFKAPANLSQPVGVTLFDVNAYAKDSGLGPLVAATYMTVEEGTATVSIPATSSVVSSTLVPAGTNSAAATSASAASNPAQTNAALRAIVLPSVSMVWMGITFLIIT